MNLETRTSDLEMSPPLFFLSDFTTYREQYCLCLNCWLFQLCQEIQFDCYFNSRLLLLVSSLESLKIV